MTVTARTLFLGYGFSAAALAPKLHSAGHHILATTRSPEKLSTIQDLGYSGILTDGSVKTNSALQNAFMSAEYVVVSAPPSAEGDPFLPLLGDALESPDCSISWLGYLSTTGVYGDRQGGWAFEYESPRPGQRRSHWRAAAEQAWRDTGLPVRLFRCAGIYGPGRSVFDKIHEGRAQRIDKPGQVFSRIHTDDIATALMASMVRPDLTGPFNLADDQPAPQHEVIKRACEMIGAPVPPLQPFDARSMSPMAASFYAESRRVSNARAKAQLGWRPQYPTYDAGLKAILAAENSH